MVESSFDKWPVEFKIVKMTTSPMNQELELYFLSGIMNIEQANTLKAKIPIISEFNTNKKQVVVSTVVNYRQLMNTYESFTQLAKEWRGQYYVLTNKFVEVCKEFI